VAAVAEARVGDDDPLRVERSTLPFAPLPLNIFSVSRPAIARNGRPDPDRLNRTRDNSAASTPGLANRRPAAHPGITCHAFHTMQRLAWTLLHDGASRDLRENPPCKRLGSRVMWPKNATPSGGALRRPPRGKSAADRP
jgi:hypothetical protein